MFEYAGLFGMGSEKQKIAVGKKEILGFKGLNEVFPQSLIIIGKANAKEKEALEKLHT